LKKKKGKNIDEAWTEAALQNLVTKAQRWGTTSSLKFKSLQKHAQG